MVGDLILFDHILPYYHLQFLEVDSSAPPPAKKRKQSTMATYMVRPCPVTRTRKLHNLVFNMIATDMQPSSVVNDKGFVLLVHELDLCYTLPSAKVLTQTLMPAAYAKAKESLTAKLSDAEMVSLTTDGWTSRTTESYCATTVHFLDNQWKLCVYLLDCSYMGERHTAINLGEQINKVCTD